VTSVDANTSPFRRKKKGQTKKIFHGKERTGRERYNNNKKGVNTLSSIGEGRDCQKLLPTGSCQQKKALQLRGRKRERGKKNI